MKSYQKFLKQKLPKMVLDGINDPKLPKVMKPFQRAATKWALRRKRSALFAGTGLGKTLKQLVWADNVSKHEQGDVLILTPLAVAEQTVREAEKFGIKDVKYSSGKDWGDRISITNYDRMDRFSPDNYCAVVLDESSVLKHQDSKTRLFLTDAWAKTDWKLCCTATPAPNDYVEIGSHSEFLGILDQQEMLAEFFVHEGAIRAGDAEADWRLKRHAEADFWRWMSTWALVYNSPDDLGFPDNSYILPELRRHIIEVDFERKPAPGQLFASGKMSLRERMDMRKQTTNARCEAAAKLINADPKSSWLIWCGRNDEADYLEKLIKDSLQVSGSMDRGMKASRLLGFTENDPRIMITKPSIAGFGLNWQHCHKMVFVGLNDSFEQLYQAIRRCWRFGQQYPVDIWLVSSTAEYTVLKNVLDKEQRALSMYASMRELSRLAVQSDDVTGRRESKYTKFNERMPEWL